MLVRTCALAAPGWAAETPSGTVSLRSTLVAAGGGEMPQLTR
jgi:hypothetical protein